MFAYFFNRNVQKQQETVLNSEINDNPVFCILSAVERQTGPVVEVQSIETLAWNVFGCGGHISGLRDNDALLLRLGRI